MKHEKTNEAMNEFLRASRTIQEMTISEEIVQDPVAVRVNEFLRAGRVEAEADRPESGD